MNLWGKSRRRTVTVLASTLVFASLSGPVYADAFDAARLDKPEGHVTLTIGDGGLSIQSMLMIQPPDPAPGQERGEWRFCNTTADPVCDFNNPKLDILATVVLPLCKSQSDENCVEGLQMTLAGKTVQANYLRDAAAGNRTPANPELDFFEGGTPLLFEVPGVIHEGGTNTYAVTATANRRFDHKLKKFITGNLALDVVPYTTKFDPDYDLAGYGYGKNIGCLFIELSTCAVREDFPADVNVSLAVRAPMDIAGWFMGRVKNPLIDVDRISPRNNRIEVSAETATVARFALVKSPEEITPSIRKAMGNFGIGPTLYGYGIGTSASDEGAFATLDYFRKEVKDTASGVNTLWSVGTIDSPSVGCFADRSKVLGIVATNAMVYNGGAPRYEDGFLAYKVGGMHYMPGGKDLVIGTYDLIMRSETARCLYGFSSAPITATIQVLGGAGAERVATTVVSEKDGWLKLAAYGFTFSRKEVRVKLTQLKALSISGFARGSSTLNPEQIKQVRLLANQVRSKQTAVCEAGYTNFANKAIAGARAASVCSQLKRFQPRLQTKAVAVLVKTTSSLGTVTVKTK